MKENTNFFERIMQIAEYKGFKSLNKFAKIGLNYTSSEKLNRLREGNGNPSVDIILDITNKFEDIDATWFLTGNGEMLKTETKQRDIPFYDTEVMAGRELVASMDAVSQPVEMIDAGDWFRDADGAMRVHGNSMQTKYPPGSIIAFKEVRDRELIIYGRDYVIETSEYRILKRLQKNSSPEYVLACSYNEDKDAVGNVIHAPFEVPLGKISRLFEVLGKVEREASSRIVYNKRQKA